MYLKSIELQGFKSFIDKTVIRLDDGISCIVGPNGSGKSNISDAIRWVLGEQSARNLRGSKMEDVIFSGSDSRKAVGMAQVVLHIDNSDGKLPLEFTDIEICRRAYRSGDSEYLINGSACRLKDIQELFLDSGISNNSLAIVGQGRVQQIVDMKPDERRGLIEEAAGVIKYRNRKKSAVRKLADTENNLARVWDIISELAERLEPLAEQKEKAEKYLELKKQADAKEINLLVQILKENKTQIETVKQEIEKRRDALVQTTAKLGTVDAEYEILRSELEEKEKALTFEQQELFQHKSDIQRSEAQAALLAERSDTAKKNIERLENELQLILSRDDGFMLQVQKLEADCSFLEQEKQNLETEREQAEAEYQQQKEVLNELNATCELTRDELFDLASQLADCRNQLSYQEQTLNENRSRRELLTANLQALQSGNSDLDLQKERLKEKLGEIKNAMDGYSKEQADIEQRLKALTDDKVKIAEKEVSNRLKLNSMQSRLKVLQEFAENLEGFHPGVRALLKAKKQKQPIGDKIIGSVVDLISIEPRYATAIEAALAAGLQNLVVQNADDAKAAVAYLKKENLGRATFLPIDDLVCKTHHGLDKVLKQPGVIGRCADVVECDPKHRVVIEYLLNNILLVEDLDTAVKIARQSQHSFKIITIEADLIRTGGAITGGSQAKNSGDLLKKRTQLKAMETEVKKLISDQERYQTELEQLNQKEQTELSRKADVDARHKELEFEAISISKDIDHLQDSLAEKARQSQNYQEQIRVLTDEETQHIKRCEELKSQIDNWQDLNDNTNQKLVSYQAEIQKLQISIDDMQQDISQKRAAAAAGEQKYLAVKSEVERLRQEKSSLFTKVGDIKQDLSNWQNEYQALKDQRIANETEQKQLAELIINAQASLEKAADILNENKQRMEALNAESGRLNREQSMSQQELHQLELKQTRLDTEWINESAKLNENFMLSYEEALPYLDPEETVRQLQKNVKELRMNINQLGNVNIDAIEEYQMVFERHSFLTAQRQDLLDARDSLNKVIREMDSIMIKRFSEAFAAVNEQFDQTFCKLFGGGTAGLVMTEPDNILETGIEIVVRPPGKKLVNYNLLSGGEKSLIGISLILAVFLVNPSPLCVLDEVDAALDEANVDRFGQYLQCFTDKTQFVVVSHRQGTMEAASSLWGVTMAADGVSKLVSVKLSDLSA